MKEGETVSGNEGVMDFYVDMETVSSQSTLALAETEWIHPFDCCYSFDYECLVITLLLCALINFVKLQVCAKASSSLLFILLGPLELTNNVKTYFNSCDNHTLNNTPSNVYLVINP